ncbi:MAG: hypothetical protein ABIN58_03360 [candidate division WOR-3 bacterium]
MFRVLCRLGWMALGLWLGTSVYADRLIQIPTGAILYPARLKFEFAFQGDDSRRRRWDLNLRVNDYVEVEGNWLESRTAPSLTVWNLHVNLYPEIPGYAPGISVGVRDLTERTAEGAGYYLAFSYRVPMLGKQPLSRDLILHIGVGVRFFRGLFIGIEAPLSDHLLILAEHDSRQLNAAFAWEPVSNLQFRWGSLNGSTFWGAVLLSEF